MVGAAKIASICIATKGVRFGASERPPDRLLTAGRYHGYMSSERPPLSVRELPQGQRPRERLRALGPRALSLSELFSLVIGSGSGAKSAIRLADEVLAFGRGHLRLIASASPAELERLPGIGVATSGRVLAALELGRRATRERLPDRTSIRGPADVFRIMAPCLRDLPHEEFHILLLNAQHAVLRDVLVTRGILDASLIHPREVFRPAILERAAAVILVHNHPSGDPSPSSEDRVVTRQMVEAGRSIGIAVLDHVIVAGDEWASAL
jgi:DNA repair protein RadC